MTLEVQPELPEFAAVRDALAKHLHTTQAAAASYLCGLRATQFERLHTAVREAPSEEHQRALVRIAMAEISAEIAVETAREAAAAVRRLPPEYSVTGSTARLVEQTETHADLASALVTSVRMELAAMDAAEQRANEARAKADAEQQRAAAAQSNTAPASAKDGTPGQDAPAAAGEAGSATEDTDV